jgi:hypothetical protein
LYRTAMFFQASAQMSSRWSTSVLVNESMESDSREPRVGRPAVARETAVAFRRGMAVQTRTGLKHPHIYAGEEIVPILRSEGLTSQAISRVFQTARSMN